MVLSSSRIKTIAYPSFNEQGRYYLQDLNFFRSFLLWVAREKGRDIDRKSLIYWQFWLVTGFLYLGTVPKGPCGTKIFGRLFVSFLYSIPKLYAVEFQLGEILYPLLSVPTPCFISKIRVVGRGSLYFYGIVRPLISRSSNFLIWKPDIAMDFITLWIL